MGRCTTTRKDFNIQGACDRLTSQFKTGSSGVPNRKRRTQHGSDRHSRENDLPVTRFGTCKKQMGSGTEIRHRERGQAGKVASISFPGQGSWSDVHLGKQDIERRLVDGRWSTLERSTFLQWKEQIRPEQSGEAQED